MMVKGLILAGVIAVSAAGVGAATVNQRELEQQLRIREGIRSGQLTRYEAARLEAEQAAIRVEEWRYRHSSGGLSARERADLRRDLDRASRDIYRQKQDAQHR